MEWIKAIKVHPIIKQGQNDKSFYKRKIVIVSPKEIITIILNATYESNLQMDTIERQKLPEMPTDLQPQITKTQK